MVRRKELLLEGTRWGVSPEEAGGSGDWYRHSWRNREEGMVVPVVGEGIGAVEEEFSARVVDMCGPIADI